MMRLEMVAKDLAEKLRLTDTSTQRAAALYACELALQAAPTMNPDVLSAVEELRQNGRLKNQTLMKLNDLAANLDQQYFDLQEKAEEDPVVHFEYLRLFSQARAVAALSFAGGEHALISAMEAIYEASVTVEDATQIYDAVFSFV